MPLTTIYQLKTFADLYTAVREELKIQSTDTTALNRIKRDLNIVYLEEVVPFQQWKWLRGVFDATVYAATNSGVANVTQTSNTVTLSNAISSPKAGYLFSVIGYSEIYRIQSHAANSATLHLQVPYTGATNLHANYQIWTDEIFLPSFVRETFEVTHDFQDQPLENCGLQKFRSYVAALPAASGRPYFYTTNSYVDPVAYATPTGLPAISTRASNGITKTLVFASDVSNYLQAGDRIFVTLAGDASYNGEFVIASQTTTTITYTAMAPLYEITTADTSLTLQRLQPASDTRRAKRLQLYPAIFNLNTTLHIDYIREVVGLADDTDEPLMPIGDRTILLYGALHRAWSRERNPEEAKRNLDLFVAKLTRMSGKMDDSIDQPILKPSRIYLGAKRMAQRQRDSRNGLPEGWGGSGQGGAGFTNPMTTSGDLITGGVNGAGTRLALGSSAQVLTVVGTGAAWATPTYGGGGFTNPMASSGDLITGGASGVAGRLGIGSSAQVLTVVSGVPAWGTPTYGAGGFTNPMTTSGDLITGGASGVAGRLGIGSSGQFLGVSAGAPAWSNGPLSSASFTGSTKYGNYHLEPFENNIGNSSGTCTVDWSVAASQRVVLTANPVITFSNPQAGGTYVLLLDTGAGSFTSPTWPSSVVWPGSTAPTLTATAERFDLLSFYYNGALYLGNISQNFAKAASSSATKSLNFGNTNTTKYINLGNNTMGITKSVPWSFAMWIKPKAGESVLMSKENGSGIGWDMRITSSAIQFYASGNGGGARLQMTDTSTLSTDGSTWYNVLASYAGTSSTGFSFYVNGSVRTMTINNNNLGADWASTAAEFNIADFNSGGNDFYSGKMTAVSIWGSALTSGNATSIYNSGHPGDLSVLGFYANATHWYYLDETDSASTFIDHTGATNGTGVNLVSGDFTVDRP